MKRILKQATLMELENNSAELSKALTGGASMRSVQIASV